MTTSSVLRIPLEPQPDQDTTRKIVVTGAHPGDPEAGCGGLIALLTQAGHSVVLSYLTRGEAGIEGKSHQQAANIRTAEAKISSELLGGSTHYFGQTDGATFTDNEQYQKMLDFLEAEQPDLLLTHWPMDTHLDHRACAALTYDAWLRLTKTPSLYYYEVTPGGQTQNFVPSDYADISSTVHMKRRACFAHESQKMEQLYPTDHEKMELFRGMESGYAFAEAFARHTRNPTQFA